MNDYERKLRDEVLYLHNLWHQGPPSSSNPNHQNPNFTLNPPPIHPLYPSHSTPFNNHRINPRIRKRSFPNGHNPPFESHPPRVSGPEWPVQPHASPESPGWPALKRHAPPPPLPVLAEDRARLAASKIQQGAIDASREFFTKRVGLDSEEVEAEAEEEEDGEDGCGNSEAHKFFLALFVEDSELRSYYEKSYEGGEFCCLVCAGIGKRVWKRFKGCVGLVQHSIAISNTKKKHSHRAFGHVICKVLGWDIDRIPVIVSKGEPLSRTLAQSGQSQGEPQDNAAALNDNISEVVSNGNHETCLSNAEVVAVPVVDCADREDHGGLTDSLKEADANMEGENIEKSSLDMGANKEALSCLVMQGSEPSEGSSIERPCDSAPSTGLPTTEPQSALTIDQAPAEEKKSFSVQVQREALEASCKFFAANANANADSDEVNIGKGGDNNDWKDKFPVEEIRFFKTVFLADDDLKRFYENNREGGEFFCLVCAGTGKKFNGRTALLEHVRAISVMEKNQAHAAYGYVIGKIPGWEL